MKTPILSGNSKPPSDVSEGDFKIIKYEHFKGIELDSMNYTFYLMWLA